MHHGSAHQKPYEPPKRPEAVCERNSHRLSGAVATAHLPQQLLARPGGIRSRGRIGLGEPPPAPVARIAADHPMNQPAAIPGADHDHIARPVPTGSAYPYPGAVRDPGRHTPPGDAQAQRLRGEFSQNIVPFRMGDHKGMEVRVREQFGSRGPGIGMRNGWPRVDAYGMGLVSGPHPPEARRGRGVPGHLSATWPEGWAWMERNLSSRAGFPPLSTGKIPDAKPLIPPWR